MIVRLIDVSQRIYFKLMTACSVFDSGVLKNDPYTARKVVDVLLSDMGINEHVLSRKDSTAGQVEFSKRLRALFEGHKSVWRRIVQGSSVGVQDRFACSMRNHLEGTMKQVHCRSRDQNPTFERMLVMRRSSSGVSPLFALAEYESNCDFVLNLS